MIVRSLQSLVAAAVLAVTALATAPAHADPSYTVTVQEGLTGGGFNTLNQSPFTGQSGTATASFTYTGKLSFSDTQPQNAAPTGDLNTAFGFSAANVSNYAGAGTVFEGPAQVANFNTLTGFLGSSGSASNYQYGSWYAFDLGTLAAGTILNITHDDGASVFQGGTRLGTTVSGPTTAVTDTVTVANAGDTFLYYSRQNGTPSVLNVAIPEPATIAMMAAGLLGFCFMRRRAA